MSKGYGRVERAILHALREQRGNRGIFHLGADAKELAHYIIAGEAIRTVDDPTYYRGATLPRDQRWNRCDAPCAICERRDLSTPPSTLGAYGAG